MNGIIQKKLTSMHTPSSLVSIEKFHNLVQFFFINILEIIVYWVPSRAPKYDQYLVQKTPMVPSKLQIDKIKTPI